MIKNISTCVKSLPEIIKIYLNFFVVLATNSFYYLAGNN